MKKLNKKQLEYSARKVEFSVRKLQKQFLLSLIGLFIGAMVGLCVTSESITIDDVATPISIATIMAAVGNIDNPANAQRVGKQIKAKLWVVSADQVDYDSGFPAASGREVGTIPLIAGEYWHYLGSVQNSVEPKWTGEEGDIAATITNEIPFVLGGMSDEIFNLLETGLGQEFYVIFEVCSTGKKYLLGTGCKPAYLASFTGQSSKDNTSTTITFKNESGFLPFTYVGTMPVQSADTVAADAVTITLTDNPEYQLTSGTASAVVITGFTSVADSDIGRVVTLHGSGGTYPSTITAANDFLLIGGETWTAAANAQISFKIFKDGGATYTYMEVAGSRL